MPVSRPHLASLLTDFGRLGRDKAIVSPHGLRTSVTTYAELARLSRRFAAELERREIGRGERVVLYGHNSAEWVAAFFGCIARGVVPVPIDAGSPAAFVERVAAEVSPRLTLTDSELASLREDITHHEGTIVDALKPSDTLQIIFTSGTTGAPKGIVHTHANVLASLEPIEQEFARYHRYERLVHPVRVLHTLPLSHVFGQFMGLWLPPIMGLEVHYRTRLVAPELVAYIAKNRISVLAAVPRILDLLAAHLRETTPGLEERLEQSGRWKAAARWWHFRDVHRRLGLKFWALVCGGAALREESERFWNALGFAVIQGYGMTETTALVSLNHPFKPARGTVGKVLPGREIRLGDDGEVLVRGATISNAVWQSGAMRAADSEWLATGDLGEVDAEGNLRFRGRKKDVIVTAAGLNIYPEDLESALARQSGIRGAAVVEIESPSGPQPFAFLLAGSDSQANDAVAGANLSLAEYQRIGRWQRWPEPDFPRTSTGKVLRRELSRRLREHPEPGRENALDSLGRVELQAQIEAQYGVALSDEAVQNAGSRTELLQLVSTAQPASPVPHRYPKWPWQGVMQGLRATFLEVIAMPLLRFLARPKVRAGALGSNGPFFIVANHVTSYDVPFVLKALPGRVRRRVAVAMSGEMILDWRRARNQGHWFLNWIAPLEYWVVTGLFNVFPLPQASGFRRSFQHAAEAIDRGYSVLVFPEGRRSDNGQLQPFKSGAGLLWKELGIPAVPVRIDGLGELKVRGRGWFRSGTIAVTAGEPLTLNAGETPEQLTERLRAGITGA